MTDGQNRRSCDRIRTDWRTVAMIIGRDPTPRHPAGSLPLVLWALVAVIILLLQGAQACGATVYWTLPAGQSGDWSAAANWGGTLPGYYDTACIANGGTAAVTAPAASVGSVSLGDISGSGALKISSGRLTFANGPEYIGNAGTGGVETIGRDQHHHELCLPRLYSRRQRRL